MPTLRDFGVYRLPDGESYVAAPGGSGCFYLFALDEGLRSPPTFHVTPEGRVRRWFGSGAEWDVAQLVDVGETFDEARVRVPRLSRAGEGR